MGIPLLDARLLVLEHKRKPLPKTVHLLGRQTVYLTADGARRLMRSCGVEPAEVPAELDEETRGAVAHHAQYISDRMFFAMLGVEEILAIDYTDYEGAQLIINLNEPLPPQHEGTVDFVFGGSVLDNIFDPATYVANVARLLRPGGRFFDQNIIAQMHHAYLLVTPAWMMDFYVVNRFASVHLYLCEHSSAGFVHVYGVVPSPDRIISDFGPPRGALPLGLVLVAEKGPESTSDVLPIQDQYRADRDWDQYRESLAIVSGPASYPTFAQPTALELAQLGVRNSLNYTYLGVIHHVAQPEVPLGGPLPDPGSVGGLRVVEATYGKGALGAKLPLPAVSSLYQGNVTHILASLANGHPSWEWTVDVHVLGDPYPGGGKDLEVLYYYADEMPRPLLRRAYVEAEAAGKKLILGKT
jgi:hypothetical protein